MIDLLCVTLNSPLILLASMPLALPSTQAATTPWLSVAAGGTPRPQWDPQRDPQKGATHHSAVSAAAVQLTPVDDTVGPCKNNVSAWISLEQGVITRLKHYFKNIKITFNYSARFSRFICVIYYDFGSFRDQFL